MISATMATKAYSTFQSATPACKKCGGPVAVVDTLAIEVMANPLTLHLLPYTGLWSSCLIYRFRVEAELNKRGIRVTHSYPAGIDICGLQFADVPCSMLAEVGWIGEPPLRSWDCCSLPRMGFQGYSRVMYFLLCVTVPIVYRWYHMVVLYKCHCCCCCVPLHTTICTFILS